MHRGETLTDALRVWRRFAAQKPALLLLSNNPGLLPPPEPLRSRISAVIEMGSDRELHQAGDPVRADPLFLPGMAVDLALRRGLLRELIWAFPQYESSVELQLETLREQLTANGLATVDEAAGLKLDDKVFSGRLRGVPFRAAPLVSLTQIDGPLIVHIDLSYIRKLHRNEIATPVIPLVGGVLQQLKGMRLPVLAVTFSYSHAEGEVPLGVRFLGEFLGALTEKPDRLEQPLPRRWQAQKDILYLESFFQKDEIRKLVEQQAQESTDAAWVQFNRYHTADLFKEDDQALGHLARAVALDPMYALEYLNLAQRAFDAKAPGQALRMLRLAVAAFPDNPLLRLQAAELAIQTGERETAGNLLRELQRLPWSKVYYPDMPLHLEELLKETSP